MKTAFPLDFRAMPGAARGVRSAGSDDEAGRAPVLAEPARADRSVGDRSPPLSWRLVAEAGRPTRSEAEEVLPDPAGSAVPRAAGLALADLLHWLGMMTAVLRLSGRDLPALVEINPAHAWIDAMAALRRSRQREEGRDV